MAFSNAVDATETGFQSITSGGVWHGRTLIAGTGISISNPDGTAGNPTISTTGTGGIIQQVRASSTTSVSSTKSIGSTTAPTTSNTDQIISLSCTPTNTNNILIFDFNTPFSCDLDSVVCFALFSGTTFITGFPLWQNGAAAGIERNTSMSFRYFMVAGTTSATTYSVRWGQSNGAGTLRTLQNSAGTAFYGSAITATQLIITEVSP